MEQIKKDFFLQPTIEVAKKLIGCIIVRKIGSKIISGRIVETEAYLSDDPACHGYYKKTKRNEPMFGPPGYTYIYQVHTSFCLNFITAPVNVPEAILIRALQPVEGIEAMKTNRAVTNIKDICSGPGKLCKALGITTDLNRYNITRGKMLYVLPSDELIEIVERPRIGISVAKESLLRFYEKGNIFISKK